MKEKFAKLIDIKSILTLILTAVFAYLSVIGVISEGQFVTIFMMVVAFYFGTQQNKNTPAI